MGCDIHLYVEYKDKREGSSWMSFGQKFNPGRNYLMFGILSEGVRVDTTFNYPPRGLPETIAYPARHDAFLFITDSKEESNTCTLEEAKRYESYGKKIITSGENYTPTWVEHPDWHSHSWLTLEEFLKGVEFYKQLDDNWPVPEYDAVLAAMQTLEKHGNEVRIVFWFDN